MADRVVNVKLRKKYYNLCNPDESLPPDDSRYVDIDTKSPDARGRNWSDALANRIELSEKPVCEFFTGLPGSGKSTELKHLAARLKDKDGAKLLPVLIDAETEVLTSAERVFTGGAPYLQLPVHVIYTLPPALVLRLSEPVHFLPMLKLYDRTGKRAAGFEAAREIVRQRVPDDHVREFFGATSGEDRVERLIEWSGGYPREIVRLLQTFVAESSLDEPLFKRLLSIAADQYRRTVPENALRWLARVHVEKRLIIDDDTHRATVDLMVQNNVVLRYLNDAEWFDLHPAVREMPALRDEITRFRAEQEKLREEQERSARSGG